jgi:hypothetical protein
MKFFKKFFNGPKKQEEKELSSETENLSLDQIFVNNFIKNNGKFLYCTSLQEITSNLAQIAEENSWETINCIDTDLIKLIKAVNVTVSPKINTNNPVFLGCEHLVAENGSILFSSNQLKDFKISELSDNFIVYATTSQIVGNSGDGLTGIKMRYSGNIPSNISAIKNFNINSKNEDFMNYGNTNSKNLYLLLFEDL